MRKLLSRTCWTLALVTGVLASASPTAYAQGAVAPESDAVNQADAAYWAAYNSCDFPALDKYTAEDVEFYHDLGGLTRGRAALTDSVRRNICGNPNMKLRREAVAGHVRTSLLKQGGVVYGAIIAGDHLFYHNGAKRPADQARFTTLWLRNDGAWQIKRVFSYDHAPVPYVNERKSATLTSAQLDRVAGTYNARLQPEFVLVREGSHLKVASKDGEIMHLYPQDANTFFAKEKDITIEFKPGTGAAQGFTLRMNGQVIDEPTRK